MTIFDIFMNFHNGIVDTFIINTLIMEQFLLQLSNNLPRTFQNAFFGTK
jgi:hypothetical protein